MTLPMEPSCTSPNPCDPAARVRYIPRGLVGTDELGHLMSRHGASQFLTLVSHELRTPMNGVLGMIDLVLESRLTAEQKEHLTLARQAAQSLQAVLTAVVDYSRLDEGRIGLEISEFEPARVLDDLLQLQRNKAVEKGVTFELQVAPDVPLSVLGDVNRWRQAVINLVGNALKFGGCGTVRVCARLLEPGIDAGHCLLEVAVSDEGPGIPPEQQAMIFEPFTQMDASARRRHGGLGLGLALSRHLAALMGGQLWVESQVGVGSTFGFVARLEVARPEQPSTAP